ncbi:MAG: GGDEF domain-containing protein [Sneathiellales bacterium]|nr:GGDEF domain-containing protein [Sneathiellales bacterium]
MSGTYSSVASFETTVPLPPEQDFSNYLEDLAGKLKGLDVTDETDQDKHWNLINRVLAYAASAEQHIAEQRTRIRELENLSTTDELTGLANRRALEDYINRRISSAKRYNEEGLVAFIDLDEFKLINDTHGHDTGDRVLQTLAETLIANLRDTDYVARISGDEFVFVLQKASYKQAVKRAEEIRELICSISVEAVRGKIRLSASMGVAPYSGDSSYQSILKAADKAMYQDKKKRKVRKR